MAQAVGNRRAQVGGPLAGVGHVHRLEPAVTEGETREAFGLGFWLVGDIWWVMQSDDGAAVPSRFLFKRQSVG